ncbi:MAG: pteridine-dependent deoxygenase [Dokdonella sp.]
MSTPMIVPESPAAPLRIGYEQESADALLAQPDVLAIVGFGHVPEICADPRMLCVGLEPSPSDLLEVWRSAGVVTCGRADDVRWSTDGEHLFFAIEVDEATHGGIVSATEYAYRHLSAFVAASDTPHVLRLWNYLDAINLGAGDMERYRLFCDGRARGIQGFLQPPYPAASAIGRQDGRRVLQVYGLAAARPGTPIENPRQVSAWRYPRQYGPTAPTFARGMLKAPSQLLISGTAAVVGHASRHGDDLAAQLHETFANLDSLLREAGIATAQFDAASCLKIYLRDPANADLVVRALRAHSPALGHVLVLAGDICRAELLVEIDGVHPSIA